MKKTEATGKTLDTAVENALKTLQLNRDEVDVEVVEKGGILKPFKVAVSKKQTAAQNAQSFLENVLVKMGYPHFVVEIKEDNAEGISIELLNGGQSNVIGYRGEVLDALQYLTNVVISREVANCPRISLDSEGYRQRREKTLRQLAKNLEKKVKRSGKEEKLEPMNPYERRLIHTTLQNSDSVTTESQGEGSNRHVVISPVLTSNILNSPSQRKTLNFVYRSDKKKRR